MGGLPSLGLAAKGVQEVMFKGGPFMMAGRRGMEDARGLAGLSRETRMAFTCGREARAVGDGTYWLLWRRRASQLAVMHGAAVRRRGGSREGMKECTPRAMALGAAVQCD